MVSKEDETILGDIFLIIYTVVGGLLTFVTLPKCDSILQGHISINQFAIVPYIIIGIGGSIYAHYYPDKKLNRIKSGVMVGLGLGLSIISILSIFIPCTS